MPGDTEQILHLLTEMKQDNREDHKEIILCQTAQGKDIARHDVEIKHLNTSVNGAGKKASIAMNAVTKTRGEWSTAWKVIGGVAGTAIIGLLGWLARGIL